MHPFLAMRLCDKGGYKRIGKGKAKESILNSEKVE